MSVNVILGLVTKLKHLYKLQINTLQFYKLILRFAEAKHTIIRPIYLYVAVGALGTVTLQNQGSDSYKIWHGPN